MKSRKNLILMHLGLFAVLAVYVALVTFTPLDCPLKMLFNIPCPFCGLTRAWMSALRFDFAAAFSFHPLFLLAPILIFMCFHKKLFSFISEKVYDFILVFMAFLFFALYVARLIIPGGII